MHPICKGLLKLEVRDQANLNDLMSKFVLL